MLGLSRLERRLPIKDCVEYRVGERCIEAQSNGAQSSAVVVEGILRAKIGLTLRRTDELVATNVGACTQSRRISKTGNAIRTGRCEAARNVLIASMAICGMDKRNRSIELK